MIQIKGLKKSFDALTVLNIDEFTINRSGVYAVLGPNGSGKSTLLKCLMGMIIPDEGSIHINGSSIKEQWHYRKQIAYLPQIAQFPENIKVNELFDMISDLRMGGDQRADYIALWKLQPYLQQSLKSLSGGTKQKVNLVLCFMFDVDIIVLDEPTAGLDEESVEILKKIIRSKAHKTILLSSHLKEFVNDLTENQYRLVNGKLC